MIICLAFNGDISVVTLRYSVHALLEEQNLRWSVVATIGLMLIRDEGLDGERADGPWVNLEGLLVTSLPSVPPYRHTVPRRESEPK